MKTSRRREKTGWAEPDTAPAPIPPTLSREPLPSGCRMKDGPRLEAPPAGPREQRDEHRAVVHAGDADTGVFSSAGWRAPQKAEMNASGERECSPASEGRFLPARALSDGWLLAWDQDGWSGSCLSFFCPPLPDSLHAVKSLLARARAPEYMVPQNRGAPI